jgi:hypothetical protein
MVSPSDAVVHDANGYGEIVTAFVWPVSWATLIEQLESGKTTSM